MQPFTSSGDISIEWKILEGDIKQCTINLSTYHHCFDFSIFYPLIINVLHYKLDITLFFFFYLFTDSTSRFSSFDGEIRTELATEPTWLAYSSGILTSFPVRLIIEPCITSHCRLALLMARRFFSCSWKY